MRLFAFFNFAFFGALLGGMYLPSRGIINYAREGFTSVEKMRRLGEIFMQLRTECEINAADVILSLLNYVVIRLQIFCEQKHYNGFDTSISIVAFDM